MLITKASGEKAPFIKKKYEESLRRVGLSVAETKQIGNQIYQDLYPEIPSDKIYIKTHQFLKKKNKIYAAKYSLKRAIMNLGPGGYFFERFMAAVLREYGYQTKYNQFVYGKCVEHEVDIIAQRDNKKYMVECKYHTSSGRKSDLKIVLYTYARFLDLKNSQGFSEPVLITNTSCTSEAIKYARCVGLKIIGWRYPQKTESLEYYIESKKLYPVTVLTRLNNRLNRSFREQGIVMAADLLKFTSQSLSQRFRIKESFAGSLIREATELVS
ncbi:restriction endonuclease [Patescibacteria group bacterium]|nr:restriction endonuclease [Patescibacteria group bacterium]